MGEIKNDEEKDFQDSGIFCLTLGFEVRSGKLVWVKPHTESIEGDAFLRLCCEKIMRKRPFQRFLSLFRKGGKR
jgi:hypothetical protein